MIRKAALVGAAFCLAQVPLLYRVDGPAAAHGALVSPVSRAAACGPEGGKAATSKACAAAVAKSAPGALRSWDELRVPGVAGRDREVIPDGKLCSGGLARFAGLDLPRRDWPATTLRSGAAYTFRYRATIPHTGTFRMYVTKDGYDPARPLTWSALEKKPFLQVTDPKLTAGSYTMKGRLPSGKTGRHLIYTIWRNSSTPDTYYSCSDVVFTAERSAAAVALVGNSSMPSTSSSSSRSRVSASAGVSTSSC
ncbi:lytic polysaccharide monooxygenase auxiliary activity family 9 protein [Sphaerisporangium fuscum]|uniref:lytic polysaccharide monooxygenase auxiliary activity family 9 protein n=1 Tax=Sphaerisporangium fuscum TaxID=2835868 RepID=UPI0027E35135|nr:lytic polysaccharide monooxygenase [Sphaerisporangium fuscum]